MDNTQLHKVISDLKLYDKQYYAGTPTLSDTEYDNLKTEAKKLCPTNPYFNTVGADIKNTPWKKKKHTIVMGSIANIPVTDPCSHVHDCINNAIKWWKAIGSSQLLAQPKLDGLSVNLEYENGKLISAITRGDGSVGEDILRNVEKMQNIPKEVPTHITNIHGELVLPKLSLKQINDQLLLENGKPYLNCRNAAAGIARRYDSKFAEFVVMVPFDICSTNRYVSDYERLQSLTGVAFWRCIKTVIIESEENIKNAYLSGIEKRDSLTYAVDGLVLKVNALSLRKDSSPRPSWIRALKFPPEQNSFSVDNLLLSVGKTGSISPVLENVNGIKFQDKTVYHCTLHNYNQFKKHNLAPGDTVSVIISGDVIPKLNGVLKRSGNLPFTFPEMCPICATPIVFEQKEAYCPNINCRGRIESLINAHIKEMKIEEVGKELVRKLLEAGSKGLIKFKHYPDLYCLTKEDLLKLEGFAERSSEIVLKNIANAKSPTLGMFVASLGIPDIGAKTVVKSEAKTLDDFMKLSVTDLVSKEGIGEITANAIVKGLIDFKFLIDQLLNNGIKIKEEASLQVVNIFDNASFCFTGDVQEINPDTNAPYKREEFQKLVEKYGGTNKTGVSKKLDILVVADPSSTSSKVRKARDLGIEIWSSTKFLERIMA